MYKIRKVKNKDMNKQSSNLKNSTRGITLIALVITIIVLLILAGVSIATLTGDNGILTQANEAKEKTEITSVKEQAQLDIASWVSDRLKNGENTTLNDATIKNIIETANATNTNKYYKELQDNKIITPSGYEILYSELYSNVENEETGNLPSTEDTIPYLPGSGFYQVVGTNLDNGLVITDGTNYWTWVEVPKSIYTTAQSDKDYEGIENDMETYTTTLLSRNNYTDVWYDYCGTIYDGANEYSQVVYITDSTKYETAKKYYGTLYTDTNGTVDSTGSYVNGTTYYAKITEKLNDTSGCGLTYEGYNSLKNSMLSSVYENGGFWIGQYEAGVDSYPAIANNDTRTAVIKKGVYPYNYITCSNAQKKASEINSGNCTSSLMFGIQWDLILKHLETHEVLSQELTNNSINWGNYNNSTFEITEGEYSTDDGISFSPVSATYTKMSNKNELLTTGATERNMKMNIYDLAGNAFEWTLEKSSDIHNPCTRRGASYGNSGSSAPVSYRGYRSTSESNYCGFRIALW